MATSPNGNAIDGMPRLEKLLWLTLDALKRLGGSGTIQEIDQEAVRVAGLTEAQQNALHRNGPKTEIGYRLAWARTYLKNSAAVENSGRGVWSITHTGGKLGEQDMTAVVREMARTRAISKSSDARLAEPERLQVEQVRPWQDRLLKVLQSLAPEKFEKLCQRVLRESGFTKVEVTGRTGDGGIDGIGVLRMSLLSFQVLFQCKRYRGSVGASAIRDFRGAMVGRCDKGLVITTGSFTAEAVREATRDGAPPLDLIDGEELSRLLKEKGLGVETRLVEDITINDDWFAHI